jgi:hypothetical protein
MHGGPEHHPVLGKVEIEDRRRTKPKRSAEAEEGTGERMLVEAEEDVRRDVDDLRRQQLGQAEQQDQPEQIGVAQEHRADQRRQHEECRARQRRHEQRIAEPLGGETLATCQPHQHDVGRAETGEGQQRRGDGQHTRHSAEVVRPQGPRDQDELQALEHR